MKSAPGPTTRRIFAHRALSTPRRYTIKPEWHRGGAAIPRACASAGDLRARQGNPIVIDGLWALTIGNGGNGGSLDALYFTARSDGETHGLFGVLSAAPQPSTWATMLLGFAGLGLAGYRHGATARQATA